MAGEIKVDYTILDGCITNLKTITEGVGGDEITKLIFELDSMFDDSNSEMANALAARKSEYNKVNSLLINLAANAIDMLEVAKLIYEDADLSMTAQIREKYAK